MAKTKQPTRAQRWAAAISDALAGLERVEQALSDLSDIHSDYVDWKENLPENLAQSATGQMLESIYEIDIDTMISSAEEIRGTLEEAEGLDLPRGFGRD